MSCRWNQHELENRLEDINRDINEVQDDLRRDAPGMGREEELEELRRERDFVSELLAGRGDA
jgi:hypothetical protein